MGQQLLMYEEIQVYKSSALQRNNLSAMLNNFFPCKQYFKFRELQHFRKPIFMYCTYKKEQHKQKQTNKKNSVGSTARKSTVQNTLNRKL